MSVHANPGVDTKGRLSVRNSYDELQLISSRITCRGRVKITNKALTDTTVGVHEWTIQPPPLIIGSCPESRSSTYLCPVFHVVQPRCRLPSIAALGHRQVGYLAFGSRPVGSPAYRHWGADRSVPQKIAVGGPTCRLPRHCLFRYHFVVGRSTGR